MKKYCDVHGYENVISKNKKISGKQLKAWFGIKLISYDKKGSTG